MMPSIADLSYEILDVVFSFFSSGNGWPGTSFYETQQDLLRFSQVNKAFASVAREHIARFISIATHAKARQIVDICQNDDEGFGYRVQSLLLVWPDSGIYRTRRSGVTTRDDFIELLCQFPGLRHLSLACLPFSALDDFTTTTTAELVDSDASPRFQITGGLNVSILESASALSNLRSLTFTASPQNMRNVNFASVASILCLTKGLQELTLYNMQIFLGETEESLTERLSMGDHPACQLRSLSLRLSQPRPVHVPTLAWLLSSTVTAGSLRHLTVHLSPHITANYWQSTYADPDRGFPGIEDTLSLLAPRLKTLSLLGMRTGQASAILRETSSSLQELELLGAYGLPSTLLSDMAADNLHKLHFKLLPSEEAEEHPDMPISSSAFLAEIAPGGKLANLEELYLPGNARFQKRGRWLNKDMQKACRKRGIKVVEDPESAPLKARTGDPPMTLEILPAEGEASKPSSRGEAYSHEPHASAILASNQALTSSSNIARSA